MDKETSGQRTKKQAKKYELVKMAPILQTTFSQSRTQQNLDRTRQILTQILRKRWRLTDCMMDDGRWTAQENIRSEKVRKWMKPDCNDNPGQKLAVRSPTDTTTPHGETTQETIPDGGKNQNLERDGKQCRTGWFRTGRKTNDGRRQRKMESDLKCSTTEQVSATGERRSQTRHWAIRT